MLHFAILASLARLAWTASVARRQTTGNLVGASVALDYATLNGFQNTTTGIINFKGIPYADPPIGNLRWRAPVSPPSKNLGTIDATQFGAACVRTSQVTVATETSEDCLFRNVYIPINTQVTDKLPVLVWFHGGGWQTGSSHTAPPDLILQTAAEPLVFVSFDYRLGQFGFLGGSQLAANGTLNAGLLDQRAALQWVQRYIPNFGGDPGRVTLWGQSAGAGSAMFHMMANNGDNQGLFHAVIAESPPFGTTPNNTDPDVQSVFNEFAKNAECSTKGTKTMSCLRKLTSKELALAGSKTLDSRPATLFVFGPIVDGSFVQTTPLQAFSSGIFSHVPILVGSNTDEGANWSSTLTDRSANTSMPNANETTVFNFLNGQYPNITQDTVSQAFALYPLEDYQGSVSLQAQQMYGEMRYICTAVALASTATAGGNQAYQYHYDNPHLGSNHEAELVAQFDPPNNSEDSDLALFTSMRQYWTSFVAQGFPSSSNGTDWEPVASVAGSPRILLQPDNVAMEDVPDALTARCAFWSSKAAELQI
ncbi:alpha/beta-hydrolase [Panaeolus papilionaceus]|nr:alpha/beta-hydrolase [Panaeolus papilionaceus]